MLIDRIEDVFTIKLENKMVRAEGNMFLDALINKFKLLLTNKGISFSEDLNYHPFMAWCIYREPDNIELIKKAMETACLDSSWVIDLSDNEWVTKSLDLLSVTNSKDLDIDIKLSATEPSQSDLTRIDRALHLIKESWPEAYEQIQLLTKKIVMVQSNGENFTSATAAYAFGAVFIKNKEHYNAINYLDILLHESGHQALMVKQTFGRMIENLTFKADSPLRKDQRWLNGTLHATYVIWRVLIGFSKIINTKIDLNSEEIVTLNELKKEFLKNLEKGIEILDKNAIFTDLGQMFMEEIRNDFFNLTL